MTPISRAVRLEILNLHNQNLPNSKWNDKHLERYFANDYLHPICITIEGRNGLIGLAIGRLSFNNHSKLNLSTLSVSPRSRGRGYGEDLLKEFFIAALRISSMKIIYLHFRDSNRKVKDFYTRFGFEKHKICGKYSNGERKHYMEISLKSIQKYLKTENVLK